MAEWEAQAAAELARLTQPHVTKKRATVLALVDARLAGRPEEEIWRQPGTCSRNIYHTKWKKDPTFAGVVENVERLAREWQDTKALRALKQAAERLALASPAAVGKAIEIMAQGDDPNVVLRAAFGILDRAGVETAVKAKTETALTGADGGPVQVADALTDEERAERIATLLDRARARRAGQPAGE